MNKYAKENLKGIILMAKDKSANQYLLHTSKRISKNDRPNQIIACKGHYNDAPYLTHLFILLYIKEFLTIDCMSKKPAEAGLSLVSQ